MTLPAAPSLHICIVQPLGFMHSMALLDPALYLRHQFEQLGARVTIAKNRLRHDAPNLILGAHLGFDRSLVQSFACVFVNLEQLGEGGSRPTPEYLELLRNAPVIDYDKENLAIYARRPEEVPLISFGFAPYLDRVLDAPPLEQRPIDLLFIGSTNERRLKLIDRIERSGRTVTLFDAANPIYGPERDVLITQARAILNCHCYQTALFEQVRAFHALSLGTPLVSERTARTRPGPAFEHSVSWFDDGNIDEFFTTVYPSDDFLVRARQQLQRFRGFDPREQYARVLRFTLAASGAQHASGKPAPAIPRMIHFGGGRDYRPGWLNVDSHERSQPDLVLDLSQAQVWPARVESPFWGPVELVAAGIDVIHASNVLQKTANLAVFMGNCLSLLRDGGLMMVEVPCGEGLGAWQDPTHVRAMNENSWLYYTDWFWYLGWFEHRFKIREFSWLDARLASCDKASAVFMRVTLEKTLTTVAERMTARNMQPDFGGLLEAMPYARERSPSAMPGAYDVQFPTSAIDTVHAAPCH